MKPHKAATARTGDLGGEKIGMSVDLSALAHIMDVLTDLYQHPDLAVLREYSTNARDAHIEAGVTAPIEVFLPTKLYPFLRIIDHGVGLSVDGIRDVYSKYGASSKRGTNDQTGMLGLGCKSALTYTSQFTVIGVHNGVKATVSVSRDDAGGGVMEVVDTCATDEPNGVEVIIPAKSGSFTLEFVNAFFQFWAPGTVLVNGEQPNSIFEKAEEIAPGIFVYNRNEVNLPANLYHTNDVMVMGGVPYPVNLGGNYIIGFVAMVDVGDVAFTPSRESLRNDHEQTSNKIAECSEIISKSMVEFINNKVALANSHAEAVEAVSTLINKYGIEREFEWRGEKVPYRGVNVNAIMLNGINYKSTKYGTYGTFDQPYQAWYRVKSHEVAYVVGLTEDMCEEVDNGHLVLPRTLMRQARGYVHDETRSPGQIAFVVGEMSEWAKAMIPDSLVFDVKDIVQWKPPKKVVTGSEPAYEVYTINQSTSVHGSISHSELQALDPNKVAFASTSDYERGWRSSIRQSATGPYLTRYAREMGIDHLIIIGSNRWDKFTRAFPKVRHLHNVIAEAYNNAMADAVSKMVTPLSGRDRDIAVVLKKHAAKIEDATLRAFLESDFTAGEKAYNKALESAQNLRHALNKVSISNACVKALPLVDSNHKGVARPQPFANYPLLEIIETYEIKNKANSVIDYINAMNAKEN